MNHIHLNSTPSTQDYILENIESPKEGLLVSTDEQTHGKGQYDRSWKYFKGSLCFSFTLRPSEVITLTSLEIPVIIKKFLLEKFKQDISLKWPNDLLTMSGKKFGGILINRQGENDLIVGLGLNLWPVANDEDFLFNPSGLFTTNIKFDSKELSHEIYHYILNNRMNTEDIVQEWNEACIHLNKEVKIKENSTEHFGIFKGIGSNGQAIINNNGNSKEIYTGSLLF